MNSLESQHSPLRSQPNFYLPFNKARQNSHRKNFQPANKNPIHSTLQPLKTKIFIDEMQKTKYIHRGFYHQEMYFPNPEKKLKRDPSQYETNHKLKSKRSLSRLCQDDIASQRKTLIETFYTKQQKKKELNLSFYNTKNKSKFYMDKFHDWQKLEERSSPTYQNMLQRNIIIDGVMEKVRKNQRKFVKGF